MSSSKNYHFAQLDELPETECCCGTTQRAFADLADAPASIHHLRVKDDPTPHYHQKTAEIYLVLEGEGQKVVVDEVSLPFLANATIDFSEELIGARFVIDNPNATSSCGCGTSFSI